MLLRRRSSHLLHPCFDRLRQPRAAVLTHTRFIATGRSKCILDALASVKDRDKAAIVHSRSRKAFAYEQLLEDVLVKKQEVEQTLDDRPKSPRRCAILAKNDYNFVVHLLAIVAAQAIAIPIAPSLPSLEIQYILEQSQAPCVYVSPEYQPKIIESLSPKLNTLVTPAILKGQPHIQRTLQANEKTYSIDQKEICRNPVTTHSDRSLPGLLLYTSGTTSRPKGVVLSELNLSSQAESLIEAWQFAPTDHVLHCLPLNHIHGILNGLLSPLIAGATIEFQYPFNARSVWERFTRPFIDGGHAKDKITVFTAVPTIYKRLLDAREELLLEDRRAAETAISPANLRLNMSGSAPLPVTLKKAWTTVSKGNVLLERYGMTETGMILSCGLDADDRVDGSVGWPLPNVSVRLTRSSDSSSLAQEVVEGHDDAEGRVQVRGPSVFERYLDNEDATRAAFVTDEKTGLEWFDTGDIATRKAVGGRALKNKPAWTKGPMYFIKGRDSVDIIKRGGEKIGALEVESQLLTLDYIGEAAVFGVPSESLGEKVAAIVVLDQRNLPPSVESLAPRQLHKALRLRIFSHLRKRLAAAKIPYEIKFVDEITRNHMGKVNKRILAQEFFGQTTG